jgi:hypothetical protein
MFHLKRLSPQGRSHMANEPRRCSARLARPPDLQPILEGCTIEAFSQRPVPRYEALMTSRTTMISGFRSSIRPWRRPAAPPTAIELPAAQLHAIRPHARNILGTHPAVIHCLAAASLAAFGMSAISALGYYGGQGLQYAIGQPLCTESAAYLAVAGPVGAAIGSTVLLSQSLTRDVDEIYEMRATAVSVACLAAGLGSFVASVLQMWLSQSTPAQRDACCLPQALSNPIVPLLAVASLTTAAITFGAAGLMVVRTTSALWATPMTDAMAEHLLGTELGLDAGTALSPYVFGPGPWALARRPLCSYRQRSRA